MKFSGLVQLLASNIWAGESDQRTQRLRPSRKQPVSRKSLLPEFLSYRRVTYLFGNLVTRAKKSSERNFEFWGRAQNIGIWNLNGRVPAQKNVFFWNLAFLHKIEF
jgi:hypothetical protein